MTLDQLRTALAQKITSLDQLKALNISAVGDKLVPGYRYSTVAGWCNDWDGAEVHNAPSVLLTNRMAIHTGAPTRPQLGRDWWMIREWLRMLAGVYPEPTEALASLKAPHLAQYCLHVSKDDPTMVAYTASPDDGRNDRQVRTTLGKWLKKFCWFLNDAEIQRIEAQHRADMSNEIELLPGSEIRATYLACNSGGMRSCMTHASSEYCLHSSVHPVDAYNAPGFHLAVSRDGDGRIASRCIVWHNPDNPEDKRAVRVYGDVALRRRLLRNGYTFRDLDGAKLAVVRALDQGGEPRTEGYDGIDGVNYAVVCVPYLDGVDGTRTTSDASCLVHMGDHLLVTTPAKARELEELASLIPSDVGWSVSTGRCSGGRANLRVFKNEWRTYTCAITGQVFDTLEHPPKQLLIDGEMRAVSSLEGLTLASTYHGDTFVPVRLNGTEEVFSHVINNTLPPCVIDNATNREKLSYKRLWPKHYQDTQWVRHGHGLVSVRELDSDGRIVGTHYAKDEDCAWLIVPGPSQLRIHKADLPADATRVADCNGVKAWAMAGVRIVRTDSGRKVVPGAHDVTQLDDGTWTYDRNVERTSIVYHRLAVAHHKSKVADGGRRLWDYLCGLMEALPTRDPRAIVTDTMQRLRGTLRVDTSIGRIWRGDRTLAFDQMEQTIELAKRIHTLTPAQLIEAYPATTQSDIDHILSLARDFMVCVEFLDTLHELGRLNDALDSDRARALGFTNLFVKTTCATNDYMNDTPVAADELFRVRGGYDGQAVEALNVLGTVRRFLRFGEVVPVVPGMPHLTPQPVAGAAEVPATSDEQFALVA